LITGRFSRYGTVAGSGRFKTVYKAFDEKRGVDVAWSKIAADDNSLSAYQIEKVTEELSNGLHLDHPHVIKMYRCWSDSEQRCINSITEYFTSGNLRDYSQKHKKTLDIKAVKKWGRQILQGLAFLHQQDPPIVHGDLRTDKIYINGYNGEIKIGDLGLEELVPRRFEPGVMPEDEPGGNQYTESVDVFAFGLVMLELITKSVFDRKNLVWNDMLEHVQNEEAKDFIQQCLAKSDERASVAELLRHPFLVQFTRKATVDGLDSTLERQRTSQSDDIASNRRSEDNGKFEGEFDQLRLSPRPSTDRENPRVDICEAGSIRGEDYFFQFTGKIKDGKLHFRLHMQYEGDDSGDENQNGSSKTIDFIYDPEEDTPDEVAQEISSEFNLSPTDQDICAAALKEWLADQGPDPHR
jgi:WNK lysine deficient protein kinase